MFCCSNCFCDPEIKAIIEGKKVKGSCDFCGSKDSFVYDIEQDSTLSEMFDDLLDAYTPASGLPEDFPKESTDLIKNILFSLVLFLKIIYIIILTLVM